MATAMMKEKEPTGTKPYPSFQQVTSSALGTQATSLEKRSDSAAVVSSLVGAAAVVTDSNTRLARARIMWRRIVVRCED